MLTKKFIINNLNETNVFACKIAKAIVPDFVITLNGDLGAGKTTLTRNILQQLGVSGGIKSPTFTIVEPYTISYMNKYVSVYHFDLYRFNDPDEWFDAGFDEYFSTNSICFIEWAQKAIQLIGRVDWEVNINLGQDLEDRTIEIKSRSKMGAMCLQKLIKLDVI
jgi:tRNA threonylcarbamoyladenosine biosynthesis protein TsaE